MLATQVEQHREVIRCGHCTLVQYLTAAGACRRCRRSLQFTPPPPPELPMPVLVEAVIVEETHWGRRIATVRKERALTQGQVAIRMHVPRTFVSKLEQRHKAATLGTVLRLAAALRVEVSMLIPLAGRERAEYAQTLLADPFMLELAIAAQQLDEDGREVIIHAARSLAHGQSFFPDWMQV